MTEILTNDHLQIKINAAGAELQSFWHKQKKKEYLWQGNPESWPRRAPVLFPIVGKLNNNSYTYKETSFSLPQHGFARDKNFRVEHQSGSMITFLLSSDDETLTNYPFPFELRIVYELKEKSLFVQYIIRNTGKEEMLFSIGAHPGFICPLNEAESFSDYFLEFEKEETLERHLLTEGVFNGKTELVMKSENILPLTEGLFSKDAIVFKNMKSTYMILKSKRSDYLLKFSFPGFPYFGIWKKPGANFICLEPWLGIADNHDHSGELKNKEGILSLAPDLEFKASYSISV
ncbi:MAG: aldose 1-epimerase family protein [Bacteroidota bacterium]|nr:aldose 1-epimerase family protein [Bacteroidota bacterium]